MKTINLIFTRDFDQWVQDMVRNTLVLDAPKIWGRGLVDQIVHFDGATFRWYRYQKDMENLKKFLITRPLESKIFSRAVQEDFLRAAEDLRSAVSSRVTDGAGAKKHLREMTGLFKKMYPYYPLGIFIAGPWREDFLEVHGRRGRRIIQLLRHSREQSEGLLKLVGLHLRSWLGPWLKKAGYPSEYVRLMTAREVRNFVGSKKLPAVRALKKRSLGYVYMGGRITATRDFDKFLASRYLTVVNSEPIYSHSSVIGAVAHRGGTVVGRVRKLYNSFDVRFFRSGEILVTPMTSPEYVSAMRRAGAIITDEGGVTCHAAITSRELGIPCIIGAKIATKIFNDGDLVEVDAKHGVVRLKRAFRE